MGAGAWTTPNLTLLLLYFNFTSLPALIYYTSGRYLVDAFYCYYYYQLRLLTLFFIKITRKRRALLISASSIPKPKKPKSSTLRNKRWAKLP